MIIWMDRWGTLRTDMKYESVEKPDKCPKCKSTRMAFIPCSLQPYDGKQQRDIEAGRIVLDGCQVSLDDPKWQCAECRTQVWPKARTSS